MAAETSMVAIGDVQDAMRSIPSDAELLDDMSAVSYDPSLALQAVTGMRVDALIYTFPVQGKTVTGITVKGAKALAARRGNIEVCEPVVVPTTMQVEAGNGEWIDVPGVRATVRVRDLKTNTVFVGIASEPAVMVKRDGTTRLIPNADRVAIAKATRNGIMDHFTPVEDQVQAFAEAATKAGKVFVVGAASEQAEEVSRELAAQQAKRRAMRSQPMGTIGAAVIRKGLTAIEDEAKLKPGFLAADLGAYVARQWPGLELKDIPVQDRPMLEAWLEEKRGELGLKQAETEEPATEEIPADDDRGGYVDHEMSPEEEAALRAEAAAADAAQAAETAAAAKPTTRRAAPKPAASATTDTDGGLGF